MEDYPYSFEKYAQINWVSLGVMGGIWLYAIVDSYVDARNQIKQFRSK